MNYNPAVPTPGAPGNLVMPNGWKAEWSAQYARYFYVNVNTKESTWAMPVLPESQQTPQPLQRKPVPTQPMQPQSQSQASPPVAQRAYAESYPTPPPQVTTGYFPAPSPQTLYAQPPASISQQQYSQAPIPVSCEQNPQQQYPSSLPQQPRIGHYLPPANYQAQPQPQFSGSQQGQYQQQSYPTPVATPNSNHAAPVVPGAPHVQQMSPPRTPNSFNSQQPNSYVPMSYNQQTNVNSGYPGMGAPFNPPTHPINSSYPAQANNFSQPPQQRQTMNGYQSQTQPPAQQYQQNGYINQTQAQPQNQAHTSHRTSMMGGSLMGGNMMNKMSSKFTQLQTRATGPPAHGQPGGKPSSDWKKWAKRGAIGVAGIGALALGVDAAGDMLSGAAGMDAAVGADFSGGGGDFTGGGSDFTGGGFEGGDATGAMDAQTAVDANAAQLAMEGIGQDNAQMLLDPVGTEYTMVNDASAAGSAQIGYGLI